MAEVDCVKFKINIRCAWRGEKTVYRVKFTRKNFEIRGKSHKSINLHFAVHNHYFPWTVFQTALWCLQATFLRTIIENSFITASRQKLRMKQFLETQSTANQFRSISKFARIYGPLRQLTAFKISSSKKGPKMKLKKFKPLHQFLMTSRSLIDLRYCLIRNLKSLKSFLPA